MNTAILIAIIGFHQNKIQIDYPMGVSPWISHSVREKAGLIDFSIKNTVFNSPKCTFSALNTDTNAASLFTYYSKTKIGVAMFEKHGKKSLNKDIPFILSCHENQLD
jgi:hypothetical protein